MFAKWLKRFQRPQPEAKPRVVCLNINISDVAISAGLSPDVASSRELLVYTQAICQQLMAPIAKQVPLDDVPKAVREEMLADMERFRRERH